MFLLKLNMSLVDSAHLLASTEISFVLLECSSSWPSLKTCMFWKIKYLTWSDVPHVFSRTRNGRPWSTRSYPRSASAPYWAGTRLVARRGRAVSAHIPRWSATASVPARAPSPAEARSVRTYANTGDVCKTERKYVLTTLSCSRKRFSRRTERSRPWNGAARRTAEKPRPDDWYSCHRSKPKKTQRIAFFRAFTLSQKQLTTTMVVCGYGRCFPYSDRLHRPRVFCLGLRQGTSTVRTKRYRVRKTRAILVVWSARARQVSQKIKKKPTISKQAIVSAFYRQIDWAMHARRRKCACQVVARKRPARQSIKGHWTTCTDRAPTHARRTKARLK